MLADGRYCQRPAHQRDPVPNNATQPARRPHRPMKSTTSRVSTPWHRGTAGAHGTCPRAGYQARSVTAIRGNASEIIALAGAGVGRPRGGQRGLDGAGGPCRRAGAPVRQHRGRSRSGRLRNRCSRAILIANGHELLTKVTGQDAHERHRCLPGAPAADPLLAVVACTSPTGSLRAAATAAGGSGTSTPSGRAGKPHRLRCARQHRARIEEARP